MALLSGACLALISKLTHKLCRNSNLRHEAYLSFYASLTTVAILPIFIGDDMLRGEKTNMNSEQFTVVVEIMVCLCALKSFKSFYVDRGMRRRFKEDFDAEL